MKTRKFAIGIIRWMLFALMLLLGVTALAFLFVLTLVILFGLLWLLPNGNLIMEIPPILWIGALYVPLAVALIATLALLDRRLERMQGRINSISSDEFLPQRPVE
jgi:hypothetical protein